MARDSVKMEHLKISQKLWWLRAWTGSEARLQCEGVPCEAFGRQQLEGAQIIWSCCQVRLRPGRTKRRIQIKRSGAKL